MPSNKRGRNVAVAAMCGGVVIALWFLLTPEPEQSDRSPAGAPSPPRAERDAAERPTPIEATSSEAKTDADRAEGVRSVDLLAQLKVVRTEDSLPVPGVRAWRLDSAATPAIAAERSADRTGTAGGVVELPLGRGDSDAWMLRAPGRGVHTLIATPGQQIVRMAEGHTLRVRCLDPAGRPVESCHVVLRHRSVHRESTDLRDAIGNPLSGEARWSATTDANGTARLPELPAGDYRLDAGNDTGCARAPQSITVPPTKGPHIDLTIQAAFAIAFAPLKGRHFLQAHSSFSRIAIDSACDRRVRALLAPQLEQRFPGAKVFVATPFRVKRPPEVLLTGWLDDGTRFERRAAFVPWAALKQPLAVHAVGRVAMGSLRVTWVAGGSPVSGLPIQALGQNRRFHGKTGEWLALPVGDYHVSPGRGIHFDDSKLVLPDAITVGRRTEFHLETETRFFPVTTRFHGPGLTTQRGLSYDLQPDHSTPIGGGTTIPAGQEHRTLWFPQGEVELRVSGFRNSATSFRLDAPHSHTFELTSRRR